MGKTDTRDREKSGRTAAAAQRNRDEQEDAEVNADASEYSPSDDRPEYAPRETRPAKSGGGLRIYKPGQGYYTRMGTVIGAAILIIAGAYFLYEDVGGQIDPKKNYALYLRYGLSVGWILGMAALTYWAVGLNRKASDFFIATEGEMKKVSWSSRKEVIRSTKVVIATVVLMAVLLFVVDVAFMQFFRAIGVLKAGPGLVEIFSGGKAQ
jgi:preprotein translocase subunit SecE